MARKTPTAFDPTTTYVGIDGNGAAPIPVTDAFWPAVMAGRRTLPGWLLTAFSQTED